MKENKSEKCPKCGSHMEMQWTSIRLAPSIIDWEVGGGTIPISFAPELLASACAAGTSEDLTSIEYWKCPKCGSYSESREQSCL